MRECYSLAQEVQNSLTVEGMCNLGMEQAFIIALVNNYTDNMKFIRHIGQTIATKVMITNSWKKENKLQGINHADFNTFSENSTNTTLDSGNGHCITNIINEGQLKTKCHQQTYKKAIKYFLCHVASRSASRWKARACNHKIFWNPNPNNACVLLNLYTDLIIKYTLSTTLFAIQLVPLLFISMKTWWWAPPFSFRFRDVRTVYNIILVN